MVTGMYKAALNCEKIVIFNNDRKLTVNRQNGIFFANNHHMSQPMLAVKI